MYSGEGEWDTEQGTMLICWFIHQKCSVVRASELGVTSSVHAFHVGTVHILTWIITTAPYVRSWGWGLIQNTLVLDVDINSDLTAWPTIFHHYFIFLLFRDAIITVILHDFPNAEVFRINLAKFLPLINRRLLNRSQRNICSGN